MQTIKMTIAANVTTGSEFQQDFLFDQLIFLARHKPSDHIIVFTNDNSWYTANLTPNITPVAIRPAIKNNLLLYYWYNFRLPALLERYNADVFVSDSSALSLKTRCPQFLYIHNADFAHPKESKFVQKYLRRFSDISRAVIFTEHFLKVLFQKKFTVPGEKCEVIFHGISKRYIPLNPLQKLAALTRVSRENEYFLVPVSRSTVNHLTLILKAFSIFKKWQRSSMNLVLLLFNMNEKDLIPNFQKYKHRDEVIIIHESGDDEPSLEVGGAYAVIYLPTLFSTEPLGLNALAAGIPIITANNESAHSMYGDAALYCEVDEKSLAEKLQLLYKDENLKNRLARNALPQTAKYNLKTSSIRLYDSISIRSGM